MSGIGPVEPGEGTRAREDTRVWRDTDAPGSGPPRPRGRLARYHDGHRRAALAVLAAAVLLAAGGHLCVTRPHDDGQARAEPPHPSQVVDVSHLGTRAVPAGTPPPASAFEVVLSVESGPPVTTTRLSQPCAGILPASAPRAPFGTTPGSARKIVITMRVTECGKVPWNAGLPFLDVTLRNACAIQVHSFLLGPRYAQDLPQTVEVACSNDFR
ncbi:Tat pathway signal sequence domain protein [Streptomyces sp. NPDC051315]|uniref:Tat pathway signal sequence domain protein n=1 Tax=Streptomyces sp. NPDC051315 TaxID=3365650 RepID=UPI0037A55379